MKYSSWKLVMVTSVMFLTAVVMASAVGYAGNVVYTGGYYYGGGHHGRYYGSGVGVVIDAAYWGPSWYYPSYYYPYYPYAPYYYPYSYAPVVIEPSAPPEYIEQSPPAPASAPSGVWFYCPDAKSYYPYVKECPGGWQTVPAQPPDKTRR